MKENIRAIRRAERERIIKKRSKYWNGDYKSEKQLSKLARTSTPCSCFMCGNPRKYFNEETIQERRNKQDP